MSGVSSIHAGRRSAALLATAAIIVGAIALGPTLLARFNDWRSPAGGAGDDHDRAQPADAGHAEHDHDHGEEGHDHAGHDHAGDEHEHAGDEHGSAEHDHDHADGDHAGHDHADDEHAGHDHEHEGEDHDHDDATALELSPQALKNIGFEPFSVARGDYQRTIALPGIVVERRGRTQLHVASPLGGVVVRVHVIEGEAVASGAPLFDVRPTHEELVTTQREFLQALEEVDVVNREIVRLESLPEGVIAGSRLRDQKYDRQKLDARLHAQRQALLLHGLSEADVDAIVRTRQLLQSLTVRAPEHEDDAPCGDDHLFHVQSLEVERGQQVEAGQSMAVLADHCQLYIEGTAFEDDAQRLRAAAESGTEITADLLTPDRREPALAGLKILYIADQVDRDSRAIHFYIPLANSIALDRTEGGHRFMQWKYRPGQRVELRLPVEAWHEKLVLPSEAVVVEGAEAYVFEQESPGHFHRVPVALEFRDKSSAVIADGALHPGDVIAGRGAFQMQLEVKNQQGGGVDPHAGHSH